MTLSGGKRKVNKSLKSWVAFVKKVQKEEKLSYKDAIHRAKVRKDKGEKWMTGGENTPAEMLEQDAAMDQSAANAMQEDANIMQADADIADDLEKLGGRRRRRTMRRSRGRGRGRGRTARRARGRASRRH